MNGMLPKGWVWMRLGEVCLEPQYGWTTSANSEGKLHLLRTTDITSGKIDWDYVPFCKEEPQEKEKYLLRDGDIVISRAGSVGYSHLIKNPKESIFASYLIRFKPLINEQYIAYFLKSPSYWQSISEKSLGIAIPNVNASKLKQIPLPLPPLPEQHRIVAKIEELFTDLDAGVEALKKVKAQLKRYRQAVLKYAFEGKLTEEWRKSSPLSLRGSEETEALAVAKDKVEICRGEVSSPNFICQNKDKGGETPPLQKDLPPLPEGWVWRNLNDITEFKNGINFDKSQKGSQGILTLDVLNMYSKGIFVDTHKLYRVNKPVKDGYLLKYGDILFVRSSVKREGVGWASAFKEISEPVTFCGFIIRARLQNQKILPEYITYFLRTNFARELIVSKGSQVTITNISQGTVGQIPVPITSTAEQQKIVEEIEHRFSVADEVEKVIDNSLKQAQRLRQSILKRAFEGKLVPQNPNDEPAGKLLERIRQDKTQRASDKGVKEKIKGKFPLQRQG